MRSLSGLLLAAALGAGGVAHAQPGLSTKPDYDLIDKSDRIDDNTRSTITQLHRKSIAALQAKDYASAEASLNELLQYQAAPPNSNFLMGLAKIGLEKWNEASSHLEAAVQAEPKRPEPKTRLGLTYVKLENADAAKQQREALASLDAACAKTCEDATWIAEGMALLDQALKAGAAAKVTSDALAAVAPSSGPPTAFDPAKYNLVAFDNKEDLYDMLTKEGRCPEKATAEPRQPCALILYRPSDGSVDTLASNFKPVFKITNRSRIWAIHDKKLQEVKIDDLYFDNVDVIGGKRATYLSVAIVGNAENKANCDAGKPCLANLVSQDMFQMYPNMPDSVVQVIWGAGMKDVGTVRVR